MQGTEQVSHSRNHSFPSNTIWVSLQLHWNGSCWLCIPIWSALFDACVSQGIPQAQWTKSLETRPERVTTGSYSSLSVVLAFCWPGVLLWKASCQLCCGMCGCMCGCVCVYEWFPLVVKENHEDGDAGVLLSRWMFTHCLSPSPSHCHQTVQSAKSDGPLSVCVCVYVWICVCVWSQPVFVCACVFHVCV